MLEINYPKNLATWLDYIQALHSKAIFMGLDRVAQVATALQLKPNFPMITVAGTNGKGSTCAMLERIYSEAGFRVGCYTSPHLLRYNERVRVNCAEVDDAALCAAFTAVESARGEVPLTYFEMGTLAAVWHFMHCNLEVVILEVGLGGRLDAVNVFEPACTIVTGIDLDHMDFLGETKELIGFEKAGIYRKNIPAICGDAQPPSSLLQYADDISADLKLIGRDFSYEVTGNGWDFQAHDEVLISLLKPALIGDFQLNNAACVIEAVQCLQHLLPVGELEMKRGLQNVSLKGRFQIVSTHPQAVLDVAHNPQAALALAHNLRENICTGRTLAVFAMLADKDISGVINAVSAEIDAWYVADINHVRGAKAHTLSHLVNSSSRTLSENQAIAVDTTQPHIKSFNSVIKAYQQACLDANDNDRIVVFGSFFTVADVMSVIAFAPQLGANNGR